MIKQYSNPREKIALFRSLLSEWDDTNVLTNTWFRPGR
jgi:hypothetical protein